MKTEKDILCHWWFSGTATMHTIRKLGESAKETWMFLGFHMNVSPRSFEAYCVHLQREMVLMQPLSFAGKSLKTHLCFNEDESSHQNQQQLAVWFIPCIFLNASSVVNVLNLYHRLPSKLLFFYSNSSYFSFTFYI